MSRSLSKRGNMHSDYCLRNTHAAFVDMCLLSKLVLSLFPASGEFRGKGPRGKRFEGPIFSGKRGGGLLKTSRARRNKI